MLLGGSAPRVMSEGQFTLPAVGLMCSARQDTGARRGMSVWPHGDRAAGHRSLIPRGSGGCGDLRVGVPFSVGCRHRGVTGLCLCFSASHSPIFPWVLSAGWVSQEWQAGDPAAAGTAFGESEQPRGGLPGPPRAPCWELLASLSFLSVSQSAARRRVCVRASSCEPQQCLGPQCVP